MKRFTHVSDEVPPTHVVGTLDDYDNDEEYERQRALRMLLGDQASDIQAYGQDEANTQTILQSGSTEAPHLLASQSTPISNHDDVQVWEDQSTNKDKSKNLQTNQSDTTSTSTSTVMYPQAPAEISPEGVEAAHREMLGSYTPYSPPRGIDITIMQGTCVLNYTIHQCITAMEPYSGKSFEELRMEDYSVGRGRQAGRLSKVGFTPSFVNMFEEQMEISDGLVEGCNELNRLDVNDPWSIKMRTILVDAEVTQLLNKNQIWSLVQKDIRVVMNCFKMTGEINIIGKSEEDIKRAEDCINARIAFYKRERPQDKTYICSNFIAGKCRRRQCNMFHSPQKLPYLWQVRLFGYTWVTLNRPEDIEKAFCDNQDLFTSTEPIPLVHDGIALTVLAVQFYPTLAAVQVMNEEREIRYLECRRLTTVSYKQMDDAVATFKTQWLWYWMDGSVWKKYEPTGVQHTLEEKFLSRQPDYHFFREDPIQMYRIVFNDMYQMNMSTENKRAIRRRPLFVSRMKAPETLQPVPPPQKLPESWVSLDQAFGFELVRLTENDPELTKICDGFFKTLDRSDWEIQNVYRLQNLALWSSFSNQEKIMEDKARRQCSTNGVDKRRLYHGTDSLDAVYGICVNNFDFRLSGKNATAFGEGAYFARDASYSHRYTVSLKKGSNKTVVTSKTGFTNNRISKEETEEPTRYMFVASVLVGKYTKGKSSYRRPPNKPRCAHDLYDSCVDDESSPTIFVIFDKNQCYPEFLIEYM